MVASTVNQNRVTDTGMAYASKRMARRYKNNEAELDGGVYYFDVTSDTIAVTSLDDVADECYFFSFPKGAKLMDLVITATDMDGGATPTLELDILTEDSAGTELTLISGASSTVYEAGGTDDLDANLPITTLDVGGKKLGVKVRTAASGAAGANAVAGTVRCSGYFFMGPALSF